MYRHLYYIISYIICIYFLLFLFKHSHILSIFLLRLFAFLRSSIIILFFVFKFEYRSHCSVSNFRVVARLSSKDFMVSRILFIFAITVCARESFTWVFLVHIMVKISNMCQLTEHRHEWESNWILLYIVSHSR